jgi:hypothetical protein
MIFTVDFVLATKVSSVADPAQPRLCCALAACRTWKNAENPISRKFPMFLDFSPNRRLTTRLDPAQRPV